MEKSLTVRREQSLTSVSSLADVEGIAQHFIKCGYFRDLRDVSQAVIKIMAGAEVGLPAFASMSGIHIIEGKPAFSAANIAALMKKAGYKWRVKWGKDPIGCELTIIDPAGNEAGAASFTMEDAKRAELAGKMNWRKYPRDMCFARALTQAARQFASEVTAGFPAYTLEELSPDTTVNESGEPVNHIAHARPIPLEVVKDTPAPVIDCPVSQEKAALLTEKEVENIPETALIDQQCLSGGDACAAEVVKNDKPAIDIINYIRKCVADGIVTNAALGKRCRELTGRTIPAVRDSALGGNAEDTEHLRTLSSWVDELCEMQPPENQEVKS